ncbi:MAG: hypothetical protein U9Q97_02380 [Acidobacteriota bacterium]|nr:hypothetical protein [Acidobacteriota bacterium]
MTKEEEGYAGIKRFALDRGFSLFGVADITGIKDEFNIKKESLAGLDRGISLGKRLLDTIIEDIEDKPTALYFHHYRQLNFFLDRKALLVASLIQELGFRALPIPASQIIDWEKQYSHVSHKKVGNLAGLGWIGRNNLLVNKEFGARFRLVTVLTDMPLKPDEPVEFGCGNCRECISVCPAQAIKEKCEDFDHMACFEKLKEFRKNRIVSQYICGVCVKACAGFKKNSG